MSYLNVVFPVFNAHGIPHCIHTMRQDRCSIYNNSPTHLQYSDQEKHPGCVINAVLQSCLVFYSPDRHLSLFMSLSLLSAGSRRVSRCAEEDQ